MSDYGELAEVFSQVTGSFLSSAASVSDTELLVEYGGDFDSAGGIVDLNGTRVAYDSVIDGDTLDDPDTIVLTAPLTITADAGDVVNAVSGGQIVTNYFASVGMDEGDNVTVPVRYDQINSWPIGIYDPPQPVMVSEDLQHLEDAPGRTPLSSVEAWNQDAWVAAADDTSTGRSLTYTPRPNSLIVRKNGVSLETVEFALAGNTVTVDPSDDVIIRAGNKFSTYYLYDAAGASVSLPTGVQPIDGNTASGPISSIDLPLGTQAGDLIIVAVTFYNSGSVSDSRMTLDHSFSGQFVPMAKVYIGYEDGSGAPIGCSLYGPQDVAVLYVVRGGTIVDQGDPGGLGLYDHDNTGPIANPATAPVLPSAAFAISVVMQRNNLTASGIASSGAYTDGASIHVNPSAALIAYWDAGGTATASPADTYTFTGTLDAWGIATYEVGA